MKYDKRDPPGHNPPGGRGLEGTKGQAQIIGQLMERLLIPVLLKMRAGGMQVWGNVIFEQGLNCDSTK